MIKKIITIEHKATASDSVALSWYDMQKPNLSAVTKEGVSFIMKVKFTHLHEGDVLVSEDGYKVKVIKNKEIVQILTFKDAMDFAKVAYEIGNRHQPIYLEEYKIMVLDDISLLDIITEAQKNTNIIVSKTEGYFRPNGKAHHSH